MWRRDFSSGGLRPAGCVVGLLAAWLALTSAQTFDQRFRTGVDLVTVDVVVLDSKGMPVEGLGRGDFTISEDGRRQEISEFEAIAVAPPARVAPTDAAPPPRSAVISTNAGRAAPPGRAFAIVFDDVNLTRSQADEARKAVIHLLDRAASPDDTVSLVTTGSSTWLTARLPQDRERLLALLSRVQGKFVPDTTAERMSDFEAMRIHEFGDPTVEARVRRRYEYNRVAGLEPKRPQDQNDAPAIAETRGDVGVIAPYIQSRAEATYSLAVARNRATLDRLASAVDALRLAPGRKAAILLSKGFIYDTNLRGFKDVSRAAREANVAIYFVDARGLEAGTSQASAEAIGQTDSRDVGWAYAGIELEGAGAVSVAEDSGGFAVRNTNDLSAGIGRIANESRSYYLVGYTPRAPRRDGRFHKIQVRVNRPGLTVRARKGYYAPDDREPGLVATGLDPDVQRALDAPRDLGDVPVRATALVFDARTPETATVMISAETDVRRFAFASAGDRLTDVLEFGVAVTHLETGAVARSAQRVDMAVRPETLRGLERSWYPLSREFQLPPGPYAARVVVRDRRGARIGSVTHPFEVPTLQEFRVSTPILSDRIEMLEGQSSPKPVLMAHRTFAADGTLYCQFAVYNAATDPAAGKPRVSSSWRLRTADGRPVRENGPREIVPGPENVLIRLYGIGLAGLPPGDYELVIDVRDDLRVRSLQALEGFTVVAGLGIGP
jgi:VWFA-related protein